MKIETTERFINDLRQIAEFIAKDSKQKAQNFKNELNTQISKIALIPLSARKNLEVDNENARDLIFKGYVIPFLCIKRKNHAFSNLQAQYTRAFYLAKSRIL